MEISLAFNLLIFNHIALGAEKGLYYCHWVIKAYMMSKLNSQCPDISLIEQRPT